MNISDIQGNLSHKFSSRQNELFALLSVFTVASIIGVMLSATLFFTIILRSQLRTGSGILIAHHQLLHVLQTGISNPFYIVTGWAVWMGVSIAGIDCTVMYFVCQVIICTETWSSLFLAVNRFIALIYPHQYSHIASNKAVGYFIISAWCISAAINLPGLLGIGSLFGFREVDCGFVRVTNLHLLNAVATLGVYLPLALQGVAYGIILANHCRKDEETRAAVSHKKRFILFRLLLGSYLWY
ncbi:neuropeptide S receptor-like, partial [Paramacrobiotus metropolitanus]|uniref:neuropeptide S receptor-like n=1 Tax=Paramacrobiotus metropolitanus TaxID=2943436 RepID=UPI002445B95D